MRHPAFIALIPKQNENSGHRFGLTQIPVWISVILLCFTLLAPGGAWAQLGGTGTLNGTVIDSTGAVVVGASVSARNVETGIVVTRVTSKDGLFTLSALNPGNYTITVTSPGFETLVRENVHLNAMQVLGLDLVLQVGTANQTVTVTEAPPALETENAMLGSTVEQEVYSNLPVLQNGTQRRATDFIALMPGVNSQPTNGGGDTNTGVINGSGSRGAVAGIYINGVPITSVAGEGDPRFIWTSMPLDAVNQFQVYTAAYPASYEGQGVINYDVKGGTNNIHGSLFEFFRNTSLDTWGYLAPAAVNPLVGHATKPVEHQNEYGMTIGFPVLKDKLFLFGSYAGYRYIAGANYQFQTGPTTANLNGDFSDVASQYGFHIYDPQSTNCSTGTCTRTPFNGDVIPSTRFSPEAKAMQSFLQALYPNGPTNSSLRGNYLTGEPTGRTNWSTANRLDYHISPSHSISAVVSFGRQSTAGAGGGISGALSTSQNQMAPPFISYQQFFVKTKVLLFEDDYTISSHMVNQFKYGYGRYDSTGINQDLNSKWSATTLGISGLPSGQASDSFPTVNWSGNSNSYNRWGGYSGNRNVASGYVAIDNFLWTHGKHTVTIGGELAWMQYNFLNNATGVNPLQLGFNSAETANFLSGATLNSKTGYAYASFLLGAADSGTFNLSAVPETGARFRPISPYIQDDWKVNNKLTVNIGLRWDYYPSYLEVHDRLSWMDPNSTNSLVNYPGALVFAGKGNANCNCRTGVNNFFKNFGPRVGFAYQVDSKTVLRGSYGVFYTHGNAVGGSALSRQGAGLLGYSAGPKTATSNGQTYTNDSGASGASYWGLSQPFPSYTPPPNLNSALGTYYTTASSAAAQTVTYADPYYGGRAPQYMNWTFGLQRQLNADTTVTLSYVGSEGHFVYLDSNTARGRYSNQLDPRYLYLGTQLSNKATSTNLSKAGISAPFPTFSPTTGTIAQALKPFPQFSGVSDAYGEVGNTSFNALEAVLQHRMSHGLSVMANYTWSRSMDNAGTFRSGYDIPAAYAVDGKFHKARSLDRSLSKSDQPQKFVATGVYNLPFGKGKIGGENFIVRSLAGGWQLSGIYRVWSGSPLGVVMNSCNNNPSQQVCEPILNSSFTGRVRINGNYGHAPGSTAATLTKYQYINGDAFASTPDYMFSTLARTAPLNLRNSGSYQLDGSVRRTFPITERVKLEFEADAFNLTNHTWFGYGTSGAILGWTPSTSTSSARITSNLGVENLSRDIQFAGHIRF